MYAIMEPRLFRDLNRLVQLTERCLLAVKQLLTTETTLLGAKMPLAKTHRLPGR